MRLCKPVYEDDSPGLDRHNDDEALRSRSFLDVQVRRNMELGQVHARTGRFMRSAKVRAAHAARQNPLAEDAGVGEAVAPEIAA